MFRPISTGKDTVPFPLYKFTKLKHVKDFFLKGRLRINSIFEYVENETYNDGTKDFFEGFYVHTLTKEQLREGGHDCVVQKWIVCRNVLVFCVTEDLSYSLLKEFDADCCIEINSPVFFQAIDAQLKLNFTSTYLRKVKYFDKTNLSCHPATDDFAGVMKHDKYAHQKEYRALWEPTKKHISELQDRKEMNIEKMFASLSDYVPQEEYLKHIKLEQEWLKPVFVEAPESPLCCRLLLPQTFGHAEPFKALSYQEAVEFLKAL